MNFEIALSLPSKQANWIQLKHHKHANCVTEVLVVKRDSMRTSYFLSEAIIPLIPWSRSGSEKQLSLCRISIVMNNLPWRFYMRDAYSLADQHLDEGIKQAEENNIN